MLLRLMLLRLGPFAALGRCKDRKMIKTGVLSVTFIYCGMFLVAGWRIITHEKWKGIVWVLISMFPQYLCYSFAVWMLLRCVLLEWSERVWKRIYSLSLLNIVLGVLMETYWNPKILQFFCIFFN